MSSIQPPFRQSIEGRHIVFILTIFSVVATFEILFHRFDSFYDRLLPAQNEKHETYTRLLEGRLEVDTVIVGSSTAMFGIDPAIIDHHTGWRTYNAGRLGYAPANLSGEVIEELSVSGHVKRIIYGIDSWAFVSSLRDRDLVDQIRRGEHFLWSWALYRNRDVFFFWLNEVSEHGWRSPGLAWHRRMVEGGRIQRMGEVRLYDNGYLSVDADLNVDWPNYLRPHVKKKKTFQMESFQRAIEAAEVGGVELVVVRMPEFQRTYDEQPNDHKLLSEYLQSKLTEHDIRLLDFSLPGTFPHGNKGLFFDIHHLNSRGTGSFSEILGAALADPNAQSVEAAK